MNVKKFLSKATGVRLACYLLTLKQRRRVVAKRAYAANLIAQYNQLKAAEIRARIPEEKEKIMRYPVIELTQEKFDDIEKGVNVDLENCPIGTWFKCVPWDELPGVVVVGHIVKSEDAFAAQVGGALFSLQARYANRYRVKFVEKHVPAEPVRAPAA